MNSSFINDTIGVLEVCRIMELIKKKGFGENLCHIVFTGNCVFSSLCLFIGSIFKTLFS